MKRFLLTSLCAAALAAGCGADERSGNPLTAALSTARADDRATPTNGVTPAANPTASTNAPSVPAAAAPAAPVPTAAAAATVPPAPEPPAPEAKPAVNVPAPVSEVVRLAQTSVSDDVIVAYVDSVPEPIRLNADQIIYLRDVGISMPVIQALLRHDGTAAAQAPAAPTTAGQTVIVNPAPAAAPAPATALANGAPAPGPTGNVILTNYLAATAGGPPTGTPAIPNAPIAGAAPVAEAAPIYGPGPTPVQPPQAAVAVAVAPAAPPQTTYFYESLSPYGNWVQVENYGWCWQPSVAVVNVGWQPYMDDGHWLWTDNGWYWNSNYSWGWAPFHYGRWHHHNHHGWVWYPGTVWGPAWVTWRYSDSYCGWAPLPPEAVWDTRVGLSFHGAAVSVSFGWGLSHHHYSYVGFDHFCHREVWRHRVPRERNVTIVNNTTIVNNYNSHNTTIINGGLDKDLVARRSRSEVRKVSIQETSQPGQASRVVQDGGRTVAVNSYRPHLPAQSATPPQAILARQEVQKASMANPSGVIGGRPSATSGISAGGSQGSPGASRAPLARPAVQPSGAQLGEQPRGDSRPAIGSGTRSGGTPAASGGTVSPRNEASRPINAQVQGTPSSATGGSGGGRAQGTVPAGRPIASPETRPAAPVNTGRTELRKPEAPANFRPSVGGNPQPAANVPATPGAVFRPEATRSSGPSTVLSQPTQSAPAPTYRTDAVRPPSNVSSEPAQRSYSPPPTRTYSAPSPGADPGRSAPAPSRTFNEPVRTAPTYSAPAPRSAPAPSYSAPAPRSAPSQGYSQPAQRSAPSRQDNGGSRPQGGRNAEH